MTSPEVPVQDAQVRMASGFGRFDDDGGVAVRVTEEFSSTGDRR